MLDERKDSVASMLENAQTAQEEAQKAAEKTQQALNTAKKEALEIKEEMRKVSDAERLKIIKEAKQQAASFIEIAKLDSQKEFKNLQKELKRQITEVSIAVTKKILNREVSPGEHQALIDDCIKEIQNAS